MKPWLFHEIARHLGVVCDEGPGVAGFQIDSRLVGPGELFFALKGERVDGEMFLAEVKGRGGVGAVVPKGYAGPDFGLALIRVEDVQESLRELARVSLQKWPVKVVGITGSVGKTTTKEFAAVLLGGKFRVGKNLASYNSQLTFPLTLLNRSGEEEVMVLEMGMSQAGEIRKLVEIAPPDVAVVTKVALAHGAFFPGGVEEIARAKGEIFSHPQTKVAIFDHSFGRFVEGFVGTRVSFSLEDRGADYFLAPHEGQFTIDERGVRACQWDVPFQQNHILHDFLAAVALCRQMGMVWEEIERQVEGLQLPKMRFEQFERRGIAFVNDAYNASPESMRAALSNLPVPKEGGKRIAVLGVMKELGPFSEAAHREVGHFAQKYVDHLLVLGKEAMPLCEAFVEVKKPGECFEDHASVARRLEELMSAGDVVLVKGSRSMKMETILDYVAPSH